jgi:hypothetical protein
MGFQANPDLIDGVNGSVNQLYYASCAYHIYPRYFNIILR